MKAKPAYIVITAVAIPFAGAQTHEASCRIYGQVYTRDDQVFEGQIRWDDHETFWDDILDAAKYGSTRDFDESRGVQRRIEILGIKISWTETEEVESDNRFGIRMGRLSSIKRRNRNSAVLELKDGTRIRVGSSGTDIGLSNRGIVVIDGNVGRTSIQWSDFEKVVFSPEPSGKVQVPSQEAWRLYGTVTTWDGQQFRGFIMWDNDECLSSDFLDGEYGGNDMEIPFSKIKAIERKSSSSAIVELTSGKQLRLENSNDVNDENRGIVVKIPHYGRLILDWDDFDRAVFEKPPQVDLQGYNYYDVGEALYGRVWDDQGREYQGLIRWDDDETMTYEFLDGELEDISVMIEFGDIESIQKRSNSSAKVGLKSGRSLELTGTCDVNDKNRGIFIEEGTGQVIELDWDEFDRVVFGRP
ncbi:MAG: hypothetical protein AMJ92_03815 [candidate division Zixibacteria bacterium SM23_81]|nr:MAG: hypothetical protein AMJ92_03815 [candidate division Zixibacteria bacterium SM23_81]